MAEATTMLGGTFTDLGNEKARQHFQNALLLAKAQGEKMAIARKPVGLGKSGKQ